MIASMVDAASVAHGIHYGVLGVGLVGLSALIGPQWAGGSRAVSLHDEHAQRVRALTDHIATNGLGVSLMPVATTRDVVRDRVSQRLLPLALVSSAAAAGVHAAVAPAHFGEGAIFGLFFVGAALLQMVWSLLMVLRPTRTLLVAGVVGNVAVLALWLVTRTVGLPGLLAAPEAVGVWDVICGAFEAVVVVSVVRILHETSGAALRVAPWSAWDPVARGVALGAIALSSGSALVGFGR